MSRLNWTSSAGGILVVLLSFWIVPFYTLGDQEFYINAYRGVAERGFASAALYYATQINSGEPLHFLTIWVASRFFDKTMFVSMLNGILAYVAIRLLMEMGAKRWIALLIVLSNFYFWVLYIPAERLKLAFILFFAGCLCSRRSLANGRWGRLSAVALGLSVLAHVSVLIVFLQRVFARFIQNMVALRIRRHELVAVLVGVILAGAMFPHIYGKVLDYCSDSEVRTGDAASFLRISALFCLSMWYSKQKVETLCSFAVLFLAIYFVGEGRVNMLGFFTFLYYAIPFRGGMNFGVLATSVYFLYPTYNFMEKTILYGTTVNLYG